MCYLFTPHVTIDDEGSLSSDLAGGSVEFVIKIFQDFVLSIIEAKKEDLQKGMAQFIMELYGIIL